MKHYESCHQGQNGTVLAILEHLEFKNFSYQPWYQTIIFSVPWPLSFEIHFTNLDVMWYIYHVLINIVCKFS